MHLEFIGYLGLGNVKYGIGIFCIRGGTTHPPAPTREPTCPGCLPTPGWAPYPLAVRGPIAVEYLDTTAAFRNEGGKLVDHPCVAPTIFGGMGDIAWRRECMALVMVTNAVLRRASRTT